MASSPRKKSYAVKLVNLSIYIYEKPLAEKYEQVAGIALLF